MQINGMAALTTESLRAVPDEKQARDALQKPALRRRNAGGEVERHRPEGLASWSFEQLHIDVARNATDDFNPFHDKLRWRNIRNNPFPGPIVLGFQLETLIENQMRVHREAVADSAIIDEHELGYSNYEFRFANAVTAGQRVEINVRASRLGGGEQPALSNRVSLTADGKLALMGYKRESREAIFRPAFDPVDLGNIDAAADRTTFSDSGFFLKRKFATTSNAKNFLCGSRVEQSDYIDEISDRVVFPEMYPCSLISCALLECVRRSGHDFENDPMVYSWHHISVHRQTARELRSNDRLNLLVRRAGPEFPEHSYECYVVVGADKVLARADIGLVAIAELGRKD
jgi:hypothetical protein